MGTLPATNGAAVAQEEVYLTIEEAAKIARVSYRTIQRWIQAGVIEKFQAKPTGAVRIERQHFLDVLSAKEQ